MCNIHLSLCGSLSGYALKSWVSSSQQEEERLYSQGSLPKVFCLNYSESKKQISRYISVHGFANPSDHSTVFSMDSASITQRDQGIISGF